MKIISLVDNHTQSELVVYIETTKHKISFDLGSDHTFF